MADSKLHALFTETLTLTTAAPAQATVAPKGATGVEIHGTGEPTWNFTPRLASALIFDDSAGTYTDVTATLNEKGTTNLAILDSFEGGADFLYLGAEVPFRGVYVLIENANGTASVATVRYWNGTTWADISDTDNTASGGATLALSDTITWTTPTAWVPRVVDPDGQLLYWVRYEAATTLDAEVEVTNILPLDVSGASGPIAPVQTTSTTGSVKERYWFDPGAVNGIEATGDNNDTAIINWLITRKRNIFVAGQ